MPEKSLSRAEVVRVLRRAGLLREAEDALLVLPDPVDREVLERFGLAHGITRSVLIDLMGGSP